MGSWQDGHSMTTTWVKKWIHHSKIYEIIEKLNQALLLAIYKPHPEKIFLRMQKGADKLCKYIAGSGPIFLCYTD